MKSFLYKYFPYLVIGIVVAIIGVINHKSGTFLTGGDNLHPEFYFSENIKRSFFSVWQEYQGLGLLGGMGHASDILRQFFLLLLSFIIPDNFIRYSWTILTLFIGTAGAFALIKRLIIKYWKTELLKLNMIALTGSLFYLLNLSTIQSYFTPFEVFTAHFASLPWLILTGINYFKNPNRKNLLIAGAVSFISAPASYVPTLFLVYLMAVLISTLFYFKKTKQYFLTFIKFLITIFFVNSFWILPFAFFTLTSSGVNVDAKINQMATEGIFLQNKEYGNLENVMLLKGFWFNNIEPNLQGEYVYMLKPWIDHIDNKIVVSVGYILFGIVLAGLAFALKSRKKEGLIAGALFLFSALMLTTSTPPFSWINDLLRDHVPLYNQIFRFPFTKFSILASLSFSILFSMGILGIISWLKRFNPKVDYVVIAISIIMIVVFVLPIFKGDLFYYREQIKIPQEYFQTFDYFKTQDPNTRIANFPQYTFWAWNFYDWSYSGSGLIWYGISQPILDRNFDVWSKQNENYYWEINHALYSKNPDFFEAILNKYDVNYLLIDKNITNPVSAKSLFISDLDNIIAKLPSIKKEKEFGNIVIYKVALRNPNDNFVSSLETLNSVNSYNWSNYDPSYLYSGDYSDKLTENSEFFPFRSIFSGKTQKELNFLAKKTNESIEFSSSLPAYNKPVSLHIPSLLTANNTLPINITAKRDGKNVKISLELKAPVVYLKNEEQTKKLWESTIKKDLFEENQSAFLNININGVTDFAVPRLKNKETKIIGTASLTIQQDNIIVLSNKDKDEIDSVVISGDLIKGFFVQDDSFISLPGIKKNSFLVLRIPKLNDNYSSYIIDPVEKVSKKEAQVFNCSNFRQDYFAYSFIGEESKKLLELSSKNASPCISFYLPTLDHDQGYFLSINNKNIEGQGLHFWVLNEDQKTPLIDTYFEKSDVETNSTIILPPMERFGKAYSVHFDNISIGNAKSGNLLGKISVNPIPYYFITNIKLEEPDSSPLIFEKANLNVAHPNESLYLVEANSVGSFALSLSQSYSPYWKAYEVDGFGIKSKLLPFLGVEIKDHYMLNNWKNGWTIEPLAISHQPLAIAIVYLPQYFQYLGMIVTAGTLTLLITLWLKKRNKSENKPPVSDMFP